MRYLVAAACLFIFSHGANAVAQAQSPRHVTRVGCPSISVSSIDRAVAFYTGVLDFQVKGRTDNSSVARLMPGASAQTTAQSAELSLGSECLIVTEYDSPKGRRFPDDSRANDFWFEHIAIVVSDMAVAYARVEAARAQSVSNVPQTLPAWNKDAAGISAFYFRDPDGHYLELIHFPEGKGQPKWHLSSRNTFLGIDHTAIAVSDTRRSLEFYRDTLQMQVTGGSENYGTEQEHLSGVFNAHVRITSLRAESGIGIELLEYVSPVTGRSIPADLHPWDIACWQIRMYVRNETSSVHASHELQDASAMVPPRVDGDIQQPTWLDDPDGHLLELIKR